MRQVRVVPSLNMTKVQQRKLRTNMNRAELDQIEMQNRAVAQSKRKEYEKIIESEIRRADRHLNRNFE